MLKYVVLLAPVALLACGGTGFTYAARSGAPATMRTPDLELAVTAVENPWGATLGVDVTVKNVTDHIVIFDPDDVTITVPPGGTRHKHTNKFRALAKKNGLNQDLWDMPNIALANPVPSGGMIKEVIWFDLPDEDTKGDAIAVEYKSQRVRVPPEGK